MNDQKEQIAQRLRDANNILVTVHSNPSVDQLAACIALTLLLNKLNKHATAVYSGKTPSTIEFLKPKDTIEKNTDSLRDFIVALDKSKADKLRYKVEDEVVKIFITPYKTSISEKDLIFSQGDFNVDVVMALGIHQQQDVDAAITSHGRILHDATVVTINNEQNGELGAINWVDAEASSLSEMVTGLAIELDETAVDGQIATALLTGVVAETSHFSNQKTTPHTMSVSAALLAAGANQQLVASQLDNLPTGNGNAGQDNAAPGDGSGDTLKINRYPESKKNKGGKNARRREEQPQLPESQAAAALPETVSAPPEIAAEPPKPHPLKDMVDKADADSEESPILPPPVVDPVDSDDSGEPQHDEDDRPIDLKAISSDQTLADIEEAVHSPHVEEEQPADDEPKEDTADNENPALSEAEHALEEARRAVEEARLAQPAEPAALEPLQSAGAQDVNLNIGHDAVPEAAPQPELSAQPAAAVPAGQQQPFPDAFGPLTSAEDAIPAEPQPAFPQQPPQAPYDAQPIAAASPYGPPAAGIPFPPQVPAAQPADSNLPPFPTADGMTLPPKPPSEDSGLRVIEPLHSEEPVMPMQPQQPASPFPQAAPMPFPAASPFPAAQPAPQPASLPKITPLPNPQPLPPNPAANEPAPLSMSPSDQPFTYPMPSATPGFAQPGEYQLPAQPAPQAAAGLPPQGPPPPMPPPFPTGDSSGVPL